MLIPKLCAGIVSVIFGCPRIVAPLGDKRDRECCLNPFLENFTFRFKTAGFTEYILNERSAAYDDKCKYPCSYRKDFEQLKNDK